jgi:hypothetical protein
LSLFLRGAVRINTPLNVSSCSVRRLRRAPMLMSKESFSVDSQSPLLYLFSCVFASSRFLFVVVVVLPLLSHF